jgi:hypothetical protein
MEERFVEVERLFAEGEELIDESQDEEALARFLTAWELLPHPREEQEPAVRLLAAIADCRFYLGDWAGCQRAVQHSFRCGADVSNAFLPMRLGQSLYESGELREAANWLVPVYLNEGRAPFASEDPKYLDFIRGQLEPPPGGWPEGW